MIKILRGLSSVLFDYERSKEIHDFYVYYENIKFLTILTLFTFFGVISIFLIYSFLYSIFKIILNKICKILFNEKIDYFD